MSGAARDGGAVFVIQAETLGRGDDALGSRLMGSFLRTLSVAVDQPDAVVFYNAAVKLLAPASPHLEALRALESAGVDLLACVTCLEHFSLTGRIAVGTVSNMREIVQRLASAPRVVTV